MVERCGTTGQNEKIKMLSETRDNGTGRAACPVSHENCDSGSVTVKALPLPGALSTVMFPRCSSKMRATSESPSPFPATEWEVSAW